MRRPVRFQLGALVRNRADLRGDGLDALSSRLAEHVRPRVSPTRALFRPGLQFRVPNRPLLFLRRHLQFASRQVFVLSSSAHISRGVFRVRRSFRRAQRFVRRREPLPVVVRRALQRRLRRPYAFGLAFLPCSQLSQTLRVHALELFPGLRDLPPVLGRFLKTCLAYFVIPDATYLFLHLQTQTRFAFFLKRSHARLRVAKRRQPFRLNRPFVHLVDLS